MAIYRLLKNSTLEPEEISRITEAYEQALHTLCVLVSMTRRSFRLWRSQNYASGKAASVGGLP